VVVINNSINNISNSVQNFSLNELNKITDVYLSPTKSFNTDTEKINTIKNKCAADTYLEVEELVQQKIKK
jgi:hypothetical protein